MHRLIGSQISNWAWQFRDYIKWKYNVDLILEDTTIRGEKMLGVFVEENHPKLEELKSEATAFLQNPLDKRYQMSAWQVANTNDYLRSPKSEQDIRAWLKTGKITAFLTALCVVIYGLQLLGFEDQIMDIFHYPAYSWQDGEIWRYITHAFVHLSPLHLLFNVSWFWIFGGAIERQSGSIHLLIFVILSAAISGIMQNAFSGPAFFGLSGVVYAVLGYVLMVDKLYPHTFELPEGFFTMLIVGIAFGFISPYFGVNMGNAAHISGFIFGLIWGFVAAKWQVKA